MSELGPEARDALEALKTQTSSQGERERVRARLLGLGVAVSAGAATVVAGGAAASTIGVTGGGLLASGASAPAVPTAVGAALGGAALGGTAVTGATTATAGALSTVATATSSAASSAGLSSLGAAGLLAGTAAKLASLPVAFKASAAALALACALAVPLQSEPEPRTTRPDIASPGALPSTRSEPSKRLPEPLRGSRDVVTLEPLPSLSVPEPVPSAPEAEAPTQPRPRRAAPAATLEEQRTASSLAAESALLADALRALRNGEHTRARQLLDQHERTFLGHALLEQERERMRLELDGAH